MEMDEYRESNFKKNVSYLYARDPSVLLAWGGSGLPKCGKNLQAILTETSSVEDPKKFNMCSDSETFEILDGSNEDVFFSNSYSASDRLQTYLRVKKNSLKSTLYEFIDDETVLCKVPGYSSSSMRNMKEKDISSTAKQYRFTKIFHPNATQIELFDEVVKAKVLNFLNGKDFSLLTYGASGSGKTYTIIGTKDEPGLLPRALEYLFRSLPQLPQCPKIALSASGIISRISDDLARKEIALRQHILQIAKNEHSIHMKTYKLMQKRLSSNPVAEVSCAENVSLGVWVSFAEIYNEHIHDLLQAEPSRGHQRIKLQLGNCNGRTYIKNLTSIPVSNGMEAFQILQYGLRNLNCAATNVNAQSSRSHSIFTIKLVQAADYENGYTVSYLNFCDLAGSERVKKTLNVGDRLKESNNINTSLMVLGRCIAAIRDSQKQHDSRLIPFRESKLTLYFKRALAGLEDISMIVNINPTAEMLDESLHVLNFAAVAKDIIIEPPKQQKPRKESRFSKCMSARSTAAVSVFQSVPEDVEELQYTIDQLLSENEELRQKCAMIAEETRKELVGEYDEIICLHKKSADLKIENQKNMYEAKIREYKKQLSKQVVDVINLDSDDESEELQTQLSNALMELTALKDKNKSLQSELEENIRAVQNLRSENEELKKTIDDACTDFKYLEQENECLVKENLELKKEFILLREKLDANEDYIMATSICRDSDDDGDELTNDDPVSKDIALGRQTRVLLPRSIYEQKENIDNNETNEDAATRNHTQITLSHSSPNKESNADSVCDEKDFWTSLF